MTEGTSGGKAGSRYNARVEMPLLPQKNDPPVSLSSIGHQPSSREMLDVGGSEAIFSPGQGGGKGTNARFSRSVFVAVVPVTAVSDASSSSPSFG